MLFVCLEQCIKMSDGLNKYAKLLLKVGVTYRKAEVQYPVYYGTHLWMNQLALNDSVEGMVEWFT